MSSAERQVGVAFSEQNQVTFRPASPLLLNRQIRARGLIRLTLDELRPL